MNIEFSDLADVARRYCELVESVERVDSRWLDHLARLLPQLHAAVLALESRPQAESGALADGDLDARFRLYSHLHHLLGDRDSYWLEYDAQQAVPEKSGSLADDITDIYFELKQGLALLERDPEHPDRAAGVWRAGFLHHWGQHLVDAERHLYDLQVHQQLNSSGSANRL